MDTDPVGLVVACGKSLLSDIFYLRLLIRKPVPCNYLEIPLRCYHTLSSFLFVVSRVEIEISSRLSLQSGLTRDLDT